MHGHRTTSDGLTIVLPASSKLGIQELRPFACEYRQSGKGNFHFVSLVGIDVCAFSYFQF